MPDSTRDVAAGYHHALVVRSDGGLAAFGANFQGEGIVPSWVSSMAGNDVIAVAAGRNHSLALTGSGRAISWGSQADADVPPAARSGVTAISAGWDYSLALRGDGGLVGWGNPPAQPDACSPLPVPDLSPAIVTMVSAGDLYALALLSNGSVVGWGCNRYGEASPPPLSSTPIAVAAGTSQSIVLLADGGVVAFGSNIRTLTAVASTISDAVTVGAGRSGVYALRASGKLVVLANTREGWLGLGQAPAVVPSQLQSAQLSAGSAMVLGVIVGADTPGGGGDGGAAASQGKSLVWWWWWCHPSDSQRHSLQALLYCDTKSTQAPHVLQLC
jgi:alpha-tubulin suppressor-like RCC1 family protein